MKFNDEITLDIAKTVKDVMEGKIKTEQYDAKSDHTMDPTSHVKKDKDSGMFCVYNMKGKKVAEFKTKAEADAYARKNHDALMKKESPEEPNQPSGKNGPQTGEKDFKDKHVVKKSGEKEDGTVVKEKKQVDEILGFDGDTKSPDISKEDEIERERLKKEKMKKDEKAKETDEESEKQKAYQKVFQAALKKFGVKSPAELDKEKKKEFFDYVDKNYDAGDNESD